MINKKEKEIKELNKKNKELKQYNIACKQRLAELDNFAEFLKDVYRRLPKLVQAGHSNLHHGIFEDNDIVSWTSDLLTASAYGNGLMFVINRSAKGCYNALSLKMSGRYDIIKKDRRNING